MRYRRSKVSGTSYFFTVVTEQRKKLFAYDENVVLLREAFRHVKRKRPFVIDAAVIMPDHLHCIWTLPEDDADFSTRWRLIKTWFSKRCDEKYKLKPNRNRINKKQQAIWQHRYWEHRLKDDANFEHHVNYIHYNPVKHQYVDSPMDWKCSSVHRYVKSGVLPNDWGASGSGLMIPEDVGYE